MLFDKTKVSFEFYATDDVLSQKVFLDKLNRFSQEHNVEITQCSFLSAKKIDVYSTMKDSYKKTLLVPNLVFDKSIKVHPFNELLDAGFKNLFYIDTRDPELLTALSKELKDYGIFHIHDSYPTKHTAIFYHALYYIDHNLIGLFMIFSFAYAAIILFYYLNIRKDNLIYELWGYSFLKRYALLNKNIFKTILQTMFISYVLLVVLLYQFFLPHKIFEALIVLFTINLGLLIFILIVSILLFNFLLLPFSSIKDKKRFSNICHVAYLSKFILLLMIIVFAKNFAVQKQDLNDNLSNLEHWTNTENLFTIVELYSPFYENNLAAEYILNHKIAQVYEDLSQENKVFIFKSTNFERSKTWSQTDLDDQISYNYSFKTNIKTEEDLFSPYGLRVMVDKNYLLRNPLLTFDDKQNVLNKINPHTDVLNVLVPEKYKKYHDLIIDRYKEWFYFQKVHVTNKYKKAANQKLIEKSMDDLAVHLIYIENNQSYFTYNPNSGDRYNQIQDPILLVYTQNMDDSILAATLGNSMFLESKNEYSALTEIKEVTQKYNVPELNAIASVYDKKGNEIDYIRDELNRLTLNIVAVSCVLIALMIVILYTHYKSSLSTIIVKSLMGYPFIRIYRQLLLTNLVINFTAVLLMYSLYRNLSNFVFLLGIALSIADCLIAAITNAILLSKGELQFIKGDLK